MNLCGSSDTIISQSLKSKSSSGNSETALFATGFGRGVCWLRKSCVQVDSVSTIIMSSFVSHLSVSLCVGMGFVERSLGLSKQINERQVEQKWIKKLTYVLSVIPTNSLTVRNLYLPKVLP